MDILAQLHSLSMYNISVSMKEGLVSLASVIININNSAWVCIMQLWSMKEGLVSLASVIINIDNSALVCIMQLWSYSFDRKVSYATSM